MTLSPLARRFATIFRREAHRTQIATSVALGRPLRDDVVTPEQAAASANIEGYDGWAAMAVDRYAARAGEPTQHELVVLASALVRSPMCEVAWVEHCLGERDGLDVDTYNRMARKHTFVRPFPLDVGDSNMPLASMLRASGGSTPLEVMLRDRPWIVPSDVVSDPAYEGSVPDADMHGFDNRKLYA